MALSQLIEHCRSISPATIAMVVIAGAGTHTVYAQQIAEVIEWTDSLRLEEPPGVITVAPKVRTDSSGEFIVTDFKESQVRLYDRSGSLKGYFGSGELQNPDAAIRTQSGQILVPQYGVGLSLFGTDGRFIKRYPDSFDEPLELYVLPGRKNEVLIVGSREDWRRPDRTSDAYHLLHRFDIETGEIEQSFFPSPLQPGSYSNVLYVIGENVSADVRDNRIATAFAPLSTLYFFGLDGVFQKEVAVSLRHFRPLKKPKKEALSSAEIFDYSTKFSKITDMHWFREDVILIQYYDLLDRATWKLRWNLAAVTPDGEVLFDLADTPQLFAVDRKTGELFFSHPDYVEENRWIVGKLKESVLSSH